MNTLLVVTTGQTDVQLVSEGFRIEFPKKQCASLHNELECRVGEWTIVDPPIPKIRPDPPLQLPPSPVQICTPKLDAVLRYLNENRLTATHGLVFETRSNAATDPRFAGMIVERRLREQTGAAVWRATLLEGDERLEDRNNLRDAVICRYIVSRIEGAIREAVEQGRPDQIIVAATGGMDNVNTLVEEVVQLHAGRGVKVDRLEVADGTTSNPPARDKAESRTSTPEPAESFRARRHALKLIERGNFLAAWGAVLHLNHDEVERRWTRVVEWLYLFAASLPLPPECDIPVLKHGSMAVRAALRVELALRSGDIPRAVHGTVAFFESALWDHLYSRCAKTNPAPGRRLFQLQPAPPENLIRSDKVKESKNRKRPFEPKVEDGETWYVIHDDDVCAIYLAQDYLENCNLTRLAQTISKVRELRNDVAHNEPTPALMAEARARMTKENLWSGDDRFLTQPLVQSILRELGEHEPNSLCGDLVTAVRSRLLAPAMVPP